MGNRRHLFRILIGWLFVCAACAPLHAESNATWAYVTSFRGGAVYVVDVGLNRLVHVWPVQDQNASIGLQVSRDGRRVYIVDGDDHTRLRVLDALSGQLMHQQDLPDRRRVPVGPPIAALCGDRWLFVQTEDGMAVYDAQADQLIDVRPRLSAEARVLGGGRTRFFAVDRGRLSAFSVGWGAGGWRMRTLAVAALRKLGGRTGWVAAAGLCDGSRAFALGSVPAMRKLPAGVAPSPTSRPVSHRPPSARPVSQATSRPASYATSHAASRTTSHVTRHATARKGATASPSPSPEDTALRAAQNRREGPWWLSWWTPGQAARSLDLVRRVDLEKVTGAALPTLASSPDSRWLAIVYARRAWILRPDTLDIKWEIYFDDDVSGAAFTADNQDLLTALNGGLLDVHLANRARHALVEGQLHLPHDAFVLSAPRPRD